MNTQFISDSITTEDQNRIRLDLLIQKYGEKALGILLLERYEQLIGKKWESESLTIKRSFLAQVCSNSSPYSNEQLIADTGDIARGDVTSLASMLLQIKFNGRGATRQTEENIVIQKLRDLRNKLAHMSEKPALQNEFRALWEEAQNILLYFGVSEDEIEYVRTTSKLDGIEFNNYCVNPENMARSKSLREEGNAALQVNRPTDAIKIYDKALLLFGISKQERGTLHSNRSQAYLKALEGGGFSTDEVNEITSKALHDAKMTMELRPAWWKGYCRAGQVHKYRREFDPAIHWFEYAMSLKPDLESIRNARDECRHDSCSEKIFEHLDPLINLINRKEIKNTIAETRGPPFPRLRIDETKTMMNLMEQFMKSEHSEMMAMGCVYMAHQYYIGDHVPLDQKMAFSLFKRGADLGNPEGIYNVGMLYMYGEGVERDIKMAIKYLEMASKCPESRGKTQNSHRNLGISDAKYAIGKCYADGVGYEKDYTRAADWYRRASLGGIANASNNLAILYDNGIGVTQSSVRAMQYWRLAVEQSCPIAMQNLSYKYLEVGDVDHAEYWFGRSIHAGYIDSMVKKVSFEAALSKKRDELREFRESLPESLLLSEEPTHVLLQRMTMKTLPEALKIRELFLQNMNVQPTCLDEPRYAYFQRFYEFEAEIRKRATEGGKYAQRILLSMQHYDRAMMDLTALATEPCIPTKQYGLRDSILEDFARCYELAQVSSFPSLSIFSKFRRLVEEAIGKEDENSIRNRNARVCYFRLFRNAVVEATKFAEVSKVLYPRDPYFYSMHTSLLGFSRRHEEGLQVAEEAINMFPDDYDHFYDKAVHLRKIADGDGIGETSINTEAHASKAVDIRYRLYDEATEVYTKFVQMAPQDHRKCPESYYSIALMSYMSRKYDRAEEYYMKGLDAEKYMLPCFLPLEGYEASEKLTVESLLRGHRKAKDGKADLENIFHDSLLEADLEEIDERRRFQSTNPKRIIVCRKHRIKFKGLLAAVSSPSKSNLIHVATTKRALHVQRAPNHKSQLQDITFEKMDPTRDHVYEGYIINLTVMEDSIFKEFPSINSVVKDCNDDFHLIYFYNFDCDDPQIIRNLRYGSRIFVKNPYLRLTADMGVGIRVDDPKSVVFVSSGDDCSLCRFCWKENAQKYCGKCLRAKYCSKTCQTQDWKLLNHNDICKIDITGLYI